MFALHVRTIFMYSFLAFIRLFHILNVISYEIFKFNFINYVIMRYVDYKKKTQCSRLLFPIIPILVSTLDLFNRSTHCLRFNIYYYTYGLMHVRKLTLISKLIKRYLFLFNVITITIV